ncbi:SpoU rRNA Methylase family protein [Handroanthus impetiginosus]|uniref:SpoU rRNA Methylase family protein n=1 Tax=Handroanthus impetiginosus TaxID=429701 RepID=A0A2G9GKM3_9LAMI|nr:SpoU rRNA Methylase family protein [Handroanthus impetiginosus]
MLCPNKFLISTPFPLSNAPNSQNKFPTFRPKIKTRNFFHSPQAYNVDGSENSSRKTLSLPSNVETITSTSNPFVKHCVKLRQNSSYRHSHGLVLVVSSTPIREIYSFHKTLLKRPIIEYLLVLDNYHIPEEIYDPAIRIVRVSSAVIRKISGVQSIDSVEVVALVRIPSTFHVVSNNIHEEDCCTWFPFPHRILVLDGIQDPGNLGTLLRSATAFKWDGIFLLPGCCDPFNEKALRASRGACFQIPIVSGNWTHIETLKANFEMKLFAGHPPTNDKLNPDFKLSKDFAHSVTDSPLCLVLGSEGGGLSEVSRNACELLSIPMPGEFESLNVSVAGGIFMYMLQRENDRVG